MSRRPYRVTEDSLQARFQNSTDKIQIYAGGFANGKTSGLCVKAIRVGLLYPGANILLGRATFPKLNDTLRKEFFKWFPATLKAGFDKKENVLHWKNGTTVNFRYVAQQGKQEESTTSNLLSASYDFVGLDQAEDPEIAHKDFLDLMGRLRGSAELDEDMARYIAKQDSTFDWTKLPKTGPRWLVLTANPSRNWLYRELVRPVHMYKSTGVKLDTLIVGPDGEPAIGLFEGSTYENKDNLPADYIAGLESTYKGQMRSRYVMGEWGAFEGLVYPQFDLNVHVIPHAWILRHLKECVAKYKVVMLEGYDHGLVAPSCYLVGFVDHQGRIFIIDCYYKENSTVAETAKAINNLRIVYSSYGVQFNQYMYADPAVFRRASGNSKTIGVTVADMYWNDFGIGMQRGNNDINNGIVKVQGYLSPQPYVTHPVSGNLNSPMLYVSEKCEPFINEITDYHWLRNPKSEYEDEPQDRNNHAMDTLRYMLTNRPNAAPLIIKTVVQDMSFMYQWREQEVFKQEALRRAVR